MFKSNKTYVIRLKWSFRTYEKAKLIEEIKYFVLSKLSFHAVCIIIQKMLTIVTIVKIFWVLTLIKIYNTKFVT
jgi:hypothetical protein